ncbi:UNVERIFIED_CONTAM: hypothetical protein Sangu_1723400 [Sesamum angustifolium]|uniref:Uncharacterized protein n=1 Tax=Sesamum angustifolium TaxID=2727405 RepID=A0AAW2MLU4_9LAMI
MASSDKSVRFVESDWPAVAPTRLLPRGRTLAHFLWTGLSVELEKGDHYTLQLG